MLPELQPMTDIARKRLGMSNLMTIFPMGMAIVFLKENGLSAAAGSPYFFNRYAEVYWLNPS
jgi:hypothetical protein